MRKLQVPLRRQLRGEDIGLECELIVLSKYYEACRDIKNTLNAAEVEEMIRSSPFGLLLEVSEDFRFGQQIIWFLMKRQTELHQNNELWMNVNSRALRFSISEYCLITGLNCSSNIPDVEVNGVFRERHWGSASRQIRDADVFNRMRELGVGRGEVNVERIKLANLYFYTKVLQQRKTKTAPKIETKWTSLVEDLQAWRDYPWGSMAFEVVLESLKKDLNEIKRKETPDKKNYSVMSGFVEPLQVIEIFFLSIFKSLNYFFFLILIVCMCLNYRYLHTNAFLESGMHSHD